MARKATPDLLAEMDVSQETKPASSRMVDVFAALDGTAPVAIFDAARTPDLVPIDAIDDNPYQPRQAYNGIEELAENIRLNGLLQPPVGRTVPGGRYQVAFGHRRLRAYRHLQATYGADWGRIPMVVQSLTDDQMARHAWSENHNREDVSAVEEARLFQRMIADFGFTQQEIADDVGKSRSAVANILRLLQLPDAAQELVDSGAITERHGRELLRLAGAPHWQRNFIDDLTGKAANDNVPTVARLARDITEYIRRAGEPLPDQPVKMASTWGRDEQTNPPPWPLDGFAPRSPAVRGECAGCTWRVKFDREPAPRCIDKECYGTKKRIWDERERERQKKAAVAAAAAAMAPAPADPEAAPATPDVGWSRNSYHGNVFGTGNAPAGLIDRGLCGVEQCECFALRMLDDYQLTRGMVRPDPENAPNAVYVCENNSRLRAQRNRLEEIEKPAKAAERKQAIADKTAETKEAKQTLRELWEEIGAEGLAGSRTAMAIIAQAAKGYSYGQDDKIAAMSLGELWEWLFWRVAEKSAQESVYEDGNRRDRWVAEKAQALAETLRAESGERLPAPRPAHQPGPGDSQVTMWHIGWTNDDQDLYQTIRMNPGTHLANLERIERPLVLLRLIEVMTDNKPLRGKLWQRYNELVGAEEGVNATV